MRALQAAPDASCAPGGGEGTDGSAADEEGAPSGSRAAGSADGRRLWPSLEARRLWQDFTAAVQTIGQAAEAAQCLRDHAAAFGLLGKKAVPAGEEACMLLWPLDAGLVAAADRPGYSLA